MGTAKSTSFPKICDRVKENQESFLRYTCYLNYIKKT